MKQYLKLEIDPWVKNDVKHIRKCFEHSLQSVCTTEVVIFQNNQYDNVQYHLCSNWSFTAHYGITNYIFM